MPATTTLFRAARPAFHTSGGAAAAASRATFRATFRNTTGRRFQSTTGSGAAAGEGAAQPSWFQRMWASPVGLKTVHFWYGCHFPTESLPPL